MKSFQCVFCDEEVLAPDGIYDPFTSAICDSCWNSGGRLPRRGPDPWQFRVDNKGRPIRENWKDSRTWQTLRRTCFSHPVPATCLTLILLLTLVFIGSGLWTAVVWRPAELSVLIVLTTLIAYRWHWAMRTGKI